MYTFPNLDGTKRVLKCKKFNCYSVFTVHAVQYANMKEKIQWLSLWDVMSGSIRSAKKYLIQCLQIKQPISFVKDAAKDLVSYSVRPSWTFASEEKYQFVSPFGKIYYTTSSCFIFTFHCLFLNQFLSLWKNNGGSCETLCNK